MVILTQNYIFIKGKENKNAENVIIKFSALILEITEKTAPQ